MAAELKEKERKTIHPPPSSFFYQPHKKKEKDNIAADNRFLRPNSERFLPTGACLFSSNLLIKEKGKENEANLKVNGGRVKDNAADNWTAA